MNLADAAVAVLKEDGGALGTKEIVRRATGKGILKPKSSTPEASMGAAIYMDIKKRGRASRFVQTGPGTFKLRAACPSSSEPRGNAMTADVDAQKIGAAGESRVTSELLLRGYETGKPTIDKGVDIECSKAGHRFNIQVKTFNRHKTGRYIFRVREKPFAKHDGPEMRYVFALLDGHRFDFVVMSPKEIKRMIDGGHMTKNKAGYQASFEKTDNGIFLGKERKDMAQYRDDWDFY